jgi:hypothetical protein
MQAAWCIKVSTDPTRPVGDLLGDVRNPLAGYRFSAFPGVDLMIASPAWLGKYKIIFRMMCDIVTIGHRRPYRLLGFSKGPHVCP